MDKLIKQLSNINIIDSPGYKTDIQFTTMYGPYTWCGNPYQSGFCLTNKKGIKNVQMLKISILMSKKLFNEIDDINFAHENGHGCIQHAPHGIDILQHFFFSLDNTKQNEKMRIQFIKWLPRKEGASPLSRCPQKIIHEEIFPHPQLEIKGDSQCSICLEDIESNDPKYYLSKCHHIFHTKCIFKYLKHNNYLKKSTCDKYCAHSAKVKPFPCPNCKTTLEGP